MVDNQEAEEMLEYVRQEQIKRFGTDELLLPFEPQPKPNILKHKKVFVPINNNNK